MPVPVFHAIQYLLGNQTPREAEALPRLQGRAVLSVAHQGRRRRRLLDRLGRPRRRADAVRLPGAGLCARAWLGARTAGGPDGRARRRRRARRRQHLRGAARRLEAGPAQLLVDHRLQPAEPRRGRARGPVGSASRRCSATSAGTSSSSNTARCCRRRSPSRAASACATGSTAARTSSTRRSSSRAAPPGASASLDELGDQGPVAALIERRSRRRARPADDQSRRPRPADAARGLRAPSTTTGRSASSPTPSRATACRSPGHKDNHAGLMTPAQMDDLPRGDERPAGPRMGQVRRACDRRPTSSQAFLDRVPFAPRGRRRSARHGRCAGPRALPVAIAAGRCRRRPGFGAILNEIAAHAGRRSPSASSRPRRT